MNPLLALAFCGAGMVALSLAMPRHFQQIWPRRKHAAWLPGALRLAGISLLAVAFLYCLRDWSWPVALVIWICWLGTAALVLVVALSYWPRPGWVWSALFCAPLLALVSSVAGQVIAG